MRVAVLKSDRIGDLVLTEPAIRALKTYRASHLTLILNEATAPIMQGYQWADEIVTFRPDREGVKELSSKLKGADEFDELFVLTPHSLAYRAGLSVPAKRRYSYVYASRALARAFWSLFYKMWVDPVDMAFPYTYRHGIQHEVLQNAKVLELVGLKVPDSELDIRLPLSDEERSRALQRWESLTSDRKLLIASSRRLINGELLGRLFKSLSSEGLKPVVTVAPDEGQVVPPEVPEDRRLSLPLREFMAMIATADVVIAPNSAPLHLASAFKRPVVALFQRENFHFESLRWAPWRTYHRIVMDSSDVQETVRSLTLNTIATLRENY